MLFNIFWRSFFRQTRNYVVYFVCMVASVMIFYSFNAMTHDQPLTKRAQQDIRIENILSFGSVIVVLVVMAFMLSANRFFIHRRLKEFGMYLLFGVRRSRILLQLVIETTVLNVLSLVVGIFMGIVFSKFFVMILIKAMDLNFTSRFFISWASIVSTLWIFFFSILVLSVQNVWMLWKKQLIEFFYREQSSIVKHASFPLTSKILGISSLLVIGLAYYLAINFDVVTLEYIRHQDDFSALIWIPLLVLVLSIFGTYLFFRYGFQTLFLLVRARKNFSYQHLRMFELSKLRQLVQKNWRAQSLMSIILAIAITTIGGAMGLFTVDHRITEMSFPTDFQATVGATSQLESIIHKSGGQVTNKVGIPVKVMGTIIKQKDAYLKETHEFQVTDVISESTFKQLKTHFHKETSVPDLQPNHVLLLRSDELLQIQKNETKTTVIFANQPHQIVQQSMPNFLGNRLVNYGLGMAVVRDDFYDLLEGVSYQLSYLTVKISDQDQLNHLMAKDFPTRWGNEVYYHYSLDNHRLTGGIGASNQQVSTNETYVGTASRLNYVSRFPELRASRRRGGIFLYVALFVGMIVLLSSASILMVRQFYEANQERSTYRVLKQLGVTKKEIRRSIAKHNAWLFFPTAFVANAHGNMAIFMLSKLVQDANYWVGYLFSVITVAVFTFAYLLTTRFYSRILEEE